MATVAVDYVRARIDTQTKKRAVKVLDKMGLSVSDAIRLMLVQVVEEKRLPFDVKTPNATTRRSIERLDAGKGKTYETLDELFADLNDEPKNAAGRTVQKGLQTGTKNTRRKAGAVVKARAGVAR